MAAGSNRKESPAEPFKRVLGLAVRAIAGDGEMQVELRARQAGARRQDGAAAGALARALRHARSPSFAAGPTAWRSRPPATTSSCTPGWRPRSGPAKAVFEAVERARIEALGANRMPGMAANLTARVEDQYGHGRYAEITERADAPLEDALALMVRERLTGAAPPEVGQGDGGPVAALDRGARRPHALERSTSVAEDQAAFGRALRDMLEDARPGGEASEGEREEGDDEQEHRGAATSEAQEPAGRPGRPRTVASEDERGEGEEGEPVDSAQDADADELEADADLEEMADAREPWRPNSNVLDNPEAFGYKVFSRQHDEEIARRGPLDARRAGAAACLPRQGAAQPAERRRPARQQAAAQADGAAEPRLGFRPRGGHARHRAAHPRRDRPDARALLQARARRRRSATPS